MNYLPQIDPVILNFKLAHLLTSHQVAKHAELYTVPLELVVELLPSTSSQQWIELCLQSENASQHFQVGKANMFFKEPVQLCELSQTIQALNSYCKSNLHHLGI